MWIPSVAGGCCGVPYHDEDKNDNTVSTDTGLTVSMLSGSFQLPRDGTYRLDYQFELEFIDATTATFQVTAAPPLEIPTPLANVGYVGGAGDEFLISGFDFFDEVAGQLDYNMTISSGAAGEEIQVRRRRIMITELI